MSSVPLDVVFFLTCHLILLPIHASLTLKSLQKNNNSRKPYSCLFLTLPSFILQILAYTFLILLSTTPSTSPDDRSIDDQAIKKMKNAAAYRTIFLLAITTAPTFLTAALSHSSLRLLQASSTVVSQQQSQEPASHFLPRLSHPLLLPLISIMHAGALCFETVGSTLSASAFTIDALLHSSTIGGKGAVVLRAGLALHAVCIITLGCIYGLALARSFLSTKVSSPPSLSAASSIFSLDGEYEKKENIDVNKMNTKIISVIENNGEKTAKRMDTSTGWTSGKRLSQILTLLNILCVIIPLILRTVYRIADPLSGLLIPPTEATANSSAINIGGRTFYGLDAAMMLLVHLCVTGLAMRGGGGLEEGIDQ